MELKSLAKALRVLKCFNEECPELGVTEISKTLGMYKSTVHNLVSTLEAHGFLEVNPSTRAYRLGHEILRLGNAARSNMELRRTALPFMQDLTRATGEVVYLTVLAEDAIVYVDICHPPGHVASRSVIGIRAPMHCTGLGKAILAFLPRSEQEEISRGRPLERFTVNTITDPGELEDHLRLVQKRGYAVDNMEHEEGVKCVAAPIRSATGDVFAAISISGPSPRFSDEKLLGLSAAVIQAAGMISQRLGYDPRRRSVAESHSTVGA